MPNLHNRKLYWLTLPLVLLLFSLPSAWYHRDRLRYNYFASPTTSTLPTRRLFHLLPANKAGAGAFFCKALMSSLVHGYSPIILNWEAQGDSSYMQRLKVAGVYEFLNSLPSGNDDDVVFMMDAWDVWLQFPPQTLLERYAEYGSDVVIGADMLCWPNEADEPACRDVPESPVPENAYGDSLSCDAECMAHGGLLSTRPRWANSGTIIGTVKSMKSVYKDLTEQLSEWAYTDQGIFNEFLHQGRIKLDYYSRLFWANAHNADAGVIINARYPVSTTDTVVPYHLLPPLLYHSGTGEYPVAIHFNARFHKNLMNDWWGRLWWTQPEFRSIWQERLDRGTVHFAHNGTTFQWKDFCDLSELA
ncbi:hypothetical protein FB45DRAFT_921783 [Roridomyces roridus]|uniref:PLOD1-3-like GT domain-containing protein n=1 Tax=Roridomyces roridus TaxID=1738132 RepID=A0AAD7BMQ1_9AGAR|nr:hypothetical protein FB45DRAFT_921783 [Roridomyces roridus]